MRKYRKGLGNLSYMNGVYAPMNNVKKGEI